MIKYSFKYDIEHDIRVHVYLSGFWALPKNYLKQMFISVKGYSLVK